MGLKYTNIAAHIGPLVDKKNAQYGNSFEKAGRFLELLYPEGTQPTQYRDALILVRMFDKMCRIAQGHYEDSYDDIAGYALLGIGSVEDREAADPFEHPAYSTTAPLGSTIRYFPEEHDE